MGSFKRSWTRRGLVALGLAIGIGASGGAVAFADSTPVVTGALSTSVGQVAAGSVVRVSGGGFAPGAAVTVTLQPNVTTLGTFQASPSGLFAGSVEIPAATAPGTHTIDATGPGAEGGDLVLSKTITVLGAGSTSLPLTGADSVALLLIGGTAIAAGSGTVLASRRRRTE